MFFFKSYFCPLFSVCRCCNFWWKILLARVCVPCCAPYFARAVRQQIAPLLFHLQSNRVFIPDSHPLNYVSFLFRLLLVCSNALWSQNCSFCKVSSLRFSASAVCLLFYLFYATTTKRKEPYSGGAPPQFGLLLAALLSLSQHKGGGGSVSR